MSKLIICRGIPASGKTFWAPKREPLVQHIQEEALIERDKNRDVSEKIIRNFYNNYKDIYPLNGR